MLRRENMSVISSRLLIASVGLLMVAVSVIPTAISQQPQQPPTLLNGSAAPYWRRHGCFKVGHTRTISIPGCLVFNLSTNACRGYCMSYSVPAISDPLHFSDVKHFDGIVKPPEVGEIKFSGKEPAKPVDITASGDAGTSEEIRDQSEQLAQQQQSSPSLRPAASSPAPLPGGSAQGGATVRWTPSSGVTASTVPDERDLVTSYSQCCSMMETEEVIVNLRCGANEIRRLVFKSAKTCECFFCKHI